MIAQFSGVRRFGTPRAFVVSGHEILQQESAKVRIAAAKHAPDTFANL
jgi:hypothetical protein